MALPFRRPPIQWLLFLFDIKMQSILLTNFTFITRFVYVNLCTWHLHIIDVRARDELCLLPFFVWHFGIKVKIRLARTCYCRCCFDCRMFASIGDMETLHMTWQCSKEVSFLQVHDWYAELPAKVNEIFKMESSLKQQEIITNNNLPRF